MKPRTILITGLPRSGTTLTCELLGSLPDTVALDEPLDRSYLVSGPPIVPRGPVGRLRARARRPWTHAEPPGPVQPEVVADHVARFVEDTRVSILSRGVARTKSVEGKVIGRKVSDDRDGAGMRIRLVSVGEVPINKHVTPEFVLAVKQCGGFTAILDALIPRFPVYALIRNPLAVLSSWQTVPMPIREGRVPLAERLNPELARSLSMIDHAADRQFYLLSWFFGAYVRALPTDSIVSYEDIVATNGSALQTMSSPAATMDRPLSDRNRSRVYDPDQVKALASRLLDTEGPWWEFYTRQSVADLADQTS